MYNPRELQRKAQLNLYDVDNYAKTTIEKNEAPKQEKNIFATIGNFFTNIVEGAVKSLEGIVDAGAMLVGLFGADVDDFVSYDFTSDLFGKDADGEGIFDWSWGKDLEESSLLDDNHWLNQIAEGVGGMLPTVAVGLATGGASLAGTAAATGAKVASIGAKIAQTGTFVASAMGNASESALKEGASYEQALGYGALSGAIEAGTEFIGGRVMGSATKLDNSLLGKLAIKTGTDKYISEDVGKVAYSFASEGLEEVIADVFDVGNKRLTGVDNDAEINWSELPKTFLVGGSVGVVLDNIQNGASSLLHKKQGGKHFVKVSNNLQDIVNSNAAITYLQQNKNISQDKLNNAIVRNTERTIDNLENISKELQLMTEEQRKEAFSTINSPLINEAFEKDGRLKESVLDSYSELVNQRGIYNVSTNILYDNKQLNETLEKLNVKNKNSILNLEETSRKLQNLSEEDRKVAFSKMNTDLPLVAKMFNKDGSLKANDKLWGKNYNLELSNSSYSGKERRSFAKIAKAVSLLEEKSGVRLNVAMIKKNDLANAFVDGNTIYLSEEHLESGAWAKYLAHEVSHFAEDTKEFKKFAEFVLEDKSTLIDAVSKVEANYDFSLADVESILSKIINGKAILTDEKAVYNEIVAHITEEIFSNEESINRLARRNKTLAEKILNKIKDFLSIFRNTNAEKTTMQKLRKAEMLFEIALKSVGEEYQETKSNIKKANEQYLKDKKEYLSLSEDKREEWLKEKGYEAENFADDVLDDGNELDNFGEISYSKKGYAKKQFVFQYENFPPNNETHNTAHQDALDWARLDTVEVGDQRLISSNSYWYVVEKFSDFTNKYQVVERISDNEFDKIFKEIKENGRSGRIKSIQEGFVEYDKLNQPSYSLKARKSSSDSFETGHRRENSEVVRMVETENQRGERTGSNGTRDSSSGGLYRKGQNVKFSLKDSGEISYNKKGYAQRDINEITQKDYQHHAWAFVNNVISQSEWGVVNSAISDIKTRKKYPFFNNVYMIPTGEYDGANTIYNKIVFTDGNFETPSILRVLEVNKEFEQQNRFLEWLFKEYENGLSKSREIFRVVELYSQQQGEMFCREFSVKDFRPLQELKEQRRTFTEDNKHNQREFDGTRSDREVEFSLKDSGEIRYSIKENLQKINIEDKQEYAKLSQALASKNGNKPKKVEYVFTDNNFYVVKDNRLGHFTPVLQVEIVGNEKLIDSIKENIKNGSHRKATTIAEWAGIVQSGTRSDNRDNDSITRRETNGYANELYGEESESNARRNTSQNSRNSKKVVRYDFENGIVTYKDGTTAKFSLKDSGEIRYSFKGKKTARYINKNLDTPTLSFIRNELRKIYGPIDRAIADGIAIEKDNTIFVIDSGMEDGRVEFGVRERIIISDENLRKAKLEKINDRAISKGYVSIEISRRIKYSSDNDSNSSIGRELSEELSDNTRKSENNENRVFKKDATDGSRGLKFSLKDSGEIRYSYKARDPKTVTEKEFKHHYWAVANNLLSKEELGVLNSAIGNISRGEVYNKNSDGFFMIPVGEKGILNKIIFTDSKKGSYSINSIIEIACDNETDLTDIRSVVYARERNGIHTKNSDLFKIYYSKDFRYNDFVAKIQNYSQDSNREQDGTRSNREVKFSLKDSEKSLNEKISGLKSIQIKDEQEYQSLKRELALRNGNHPSEIEWAITDRFLYIVKDNTWNSFTPIVQIDCKKNHDFFVHLTQMIDYNNYNPIKTIDAWMTEIYAHPDSIEWINPDPLFNPYKKQIVDDEIAITLDEEVESSNYKNKDSFDRELSEQQIEFFKDSKVRDRYGRLREVYHGTYGEFYTFDKSLLGTNVHSPDAKLGFFFTASKKLAEDYSSQAKSHKMYNLIYKVANGDTDVLKFLSDNSNFYDAEKIERISATKEFSEIKKIKELEKNNKHDVFSVYLDIKNPYVEDWNKKMHNSLDMVRAITKALTNGYDGVIIKRVDASITESRPADDLYIVFEPNQIKDINNKAPTKNHDIRFSFKDKADINQYTERQYNDFGWARVNGVLSANENYNFKEKYRGIKDKTLNNLVKSASNEIIVEANNMKGDDYAVNNTLVYAKGPYEDYKITKVIKINLNTETDIESIRRSIYEWEQRGWTRTDSIIERVYGKELVRIYRLGDCPSYRELKQQGQGSSTNKVDNSFLQNGRRNLDEDSRTIKFSRKENATYTLSDGQVKKKVANFTKLKVYSKVEAESIINSILETYFNFEDYDVKLSGKTKAEVVDILWQGFNTLEPGKRTRLASKIADYIIDNAIMENIYHDVDNQIYLDTITFLKPYLHSVDLSAIKDDIKYRYDANNSVFALWSKGDRQGYTADQIAQQLHEKGFNINAEREADIFFEIATAYSEAARALKIKSDDLLANTLTETERETLKDGIVKEILRSFDTNGTKSKLANVFDKYSEKAKVWKNLYYEEKARNKAINNLLKKVGTLKGLKGFENSTQYSSEQFKGSIEKLERLNWRGNLNETGARNIVGVLNAWYNKGNAIMGAKFDNEVSEDLNRIAGGDGKLTSTEINSLANIVDYFINFIKYNRQVWENGRWIEQVPLAKEYYEKALENANLNIGAISRLMDSKYMETFADPMSIARNADRYSDGFFTKTMEDLRNGAVDSEIKAMEIASPIVDFLDKNKKYLKRVNKTTITYRGVEIPIIKAIDLYCELNRDQAILGFVKFGIKLTDVMGKKTIAIGGIESNDELAFEEYKALAQKEQAEIGKLLNDADFEFIDILEKIYNEDCKDLKKERDVQLRGYTNIDDNGYYYPTSRADTRKNINVDFFGGDRVGNESFNKSIVKGAQQTLWIESALDRVLRHIEGVSRYYYLSNPIRNFEVLYNLDLGGNPNVPKSIKTATENTWRNSSEYLRKLMQDIQGIKNGDGSFLFGFLRKGFAKFQLGLNPKVLLSQFSSLFASTNILDYKSIAKGLTVKTGDVDKYCSLAKLRDNDNAAVKSMGVLDNVDSFTNKFTTLIGKMDRRVVKILFGACQVQVQKNNGLKIGAEENKVKAGELLRKVILETQQNAIATERSKAMRSSSEFLKGTTMFTADIMKVTARVLDSFGEISTIKARLKIENDPVKREKLMGNLKLAHKKARKSIAAMVVQAVYMAMLARLFDKFYNRDEEDEEIVTDLAVDFFGNMIGGLPLIKDLYSKVFEGYDFDSFAFSSMNDLFEAVGSVDGLWSGDSREVAKTIRKISYAVGQIFGVPVRNLYNVFYGTSNLISPEFAYKINDAFYKQSYNSDLKKAIKNNDEEMITTIAGLIMDENIGAFENGSTRNEVNRLISAGFDVLPQTVGNTMTINEVQYTLTGPQKENFKKVYSQCISAVDKLVSSNGYKIATDEAKAKAIKYVYKYYYYEAQHQALNIDLDSKLYLFGQIVPIEKMALALAEVPLLVENSTNKKTVQRYLQATKLTSAQKYMLMGYFGYKNTKGEDIVKSAINKTSLTKEQKKLLLQKCGY